MTSDTDFKDSTLRDHKSSSLIFGWLSLPGFPPNK